MVKLSNHPRTIYDALNPLIRMTKIFGMTSLQYKNNILNISFLNLNRLLSGGFILAYFSYFTIILFYKPRLYRDLLICNLGCDLGHLLFAIFSDKKLLSVLNMINIFDKKYKTLSGQRFEQMKTGYKSSIAMMFITVIWYIITSYDQIKSVKRISMFTFIHFYTLAKPIVTVVWFATVSYEIARRFVQLKCQLVSLLSKLDTNCNASSLETVRILHVKLFEISNKLLSCFGMRLVTVFGHTFVYYLIDFLLYLYILREISAGLLLVVFFKGLFLGVIVWAAQNLVKKSNEVVEILSMTETNRICEMCRLQIELFQAHIACEPLRFVAFNMFEVDANFITSMISVLLTYVIVVMQLSAPILKYYEKI